jgi:Flp pilus assembly protein CpaB
LNQRARIGIIIAIVGLGLIVLGVFVVSRIIQQAIAPLPVATQPPIITSKVVVINRDVEMGTLLTTLDLSVKDIPVELVPRNSFSDINEVAGKFTKTALVGGEMVLSHHLADPTNVNHDIPLVIGDSQILMAFPATDLMSTLNIIQRGDIVDILVSSSQEVTLPPETTVVQPGEETETVTRLFTFDALQRVEVSAIVVDIINQNQNATSTSTTPEGTQPSGTNLSNYRIKAYLVALNPQDALIIKHLKDAGAIFDLVLRSPTSTESFDLNPVLSDYLIDRYQLEIDR